MSDVEFNFLSRIPGEIIGAAGSKLADDDEQIVAILREAERSVVGEASKRNQVSEQTICA